MKALTLHQPWASLVAVGAKHIETRSWPCPKSVIGERIAIHAGRGLHIPSHQDEFNRRVAHYLGNFWVSQSRGGVVVATVRVLSCVEMTVQNIADLPAGDDERLFGDYAPGRWMWNLASVELVDPPIPARGYQRIWNWRHNGNGN